MSPLPRSTSLLLAALSLSTFHSEPARAQALDLRLRLVAGALDPSGGLSYAPILASPTNAVSYDQIRTLSAAGVGIDVRPVGLPVVLRVSALRGFAREETGQWGCADTTGAPLPCTSILILVPTEIGSTQIATDVAADVPLGALTLHPIVGGSWSRFDYGWDPAPVGSFSLETGSFADNAWAFRYGIGASLPVQSLTIELERVWHRSDGDRGQADRATTTTVAISIPLGAAF
jgi:hypothetical protein